MDALEWAAGIRAAADWAEKNAEALGGRLGGLTALVYCADAEKFAAMVALVDEPEIRVKDQYVEVDVVFGPLTVQIYAGKSAVLEQDARDEERVVRVSRLKFVPALAHLDDRLETPEEFGRPLADVVANVANALGGGS